MRNLTNVWKTREKKLDQVGGVEVHWTQPGIFTARLRDAYVSDTGEKRLPPFFVINSTGEDAISSLFKSLTNLGPSLHIFQSHGPQAGQPFNYNRQSRKFEVAG